jgi:hypothetical protein
MELKDTVEMMLSNDYKERLKAEFIQLKIRYNKLLEMLDDWDNGALNFKPTCPREWFETQMEGMEIYLDVLTDRMEKEGGEIPKF